MDLAKREKQSCFIFKVDYKKAYVNVSWNNLRYIFRKMGFGAKWISWMEACVFTSSMLVLVNGGATDDFKVERWLRQRDPLSPFLFVLEMEGLMLLTETTMELGEYNSFKINEELSIDILQFADDTIIIRDSGSNNLWSIKAILRGFELISGLCLNFCKRSIFGINVSSWCMEAASSFFSCRVDMLPFKYLGIWVISSPRKMLI
ncbi:unnamed protein product [Lathyrus sativus]|nr:unnamed protein product [Lathyrus sativus]